MGKSYSELEAWGIFAGAFIIGVVLTSIFWAFITDPADARQIKQEIKNATKSNTSFTIVEKPVAFIEYCEYSDGIASWDSTGLRECLIDEYSEKNLIAMKLLCNKFKLNLSYGSFGVKCDGKS